MNYINYLTAIHSSFITDRIFWNNEINRANQQLPGFNFNPQGIPWFYAGQLFDLQNGIIIQKNDLQEKVFFIAINPKDNNDHAGRFHQVESLQSFIDAQNNYFGYGNKHVTYGRMETIMRMVYQLPINRQITYPNLHQHAIVFDLIPFHSVNSATPKHCTYIEERWNNIFSLIREEINPTRRLLIFNGHTALDYLRQLPNCIPLNGAIQGVPTPNSCYTFNYQGFLIVVTLGLTVRNANYTELRDFIVHLITNFTAF